MTDTERLLDSKQMARFVAKGMLRFDELIPDELNRAAHEEMESTKIERPPAGCPLSECFPSPSAIGDVVRFPEVQGIIESLVGPDPIYDHHAAHIRTPKQDSAQHIHGDAIIDTRIHFDIQLMYFPHDVPSEMGGTLVVPGSHFRRINEADIARYQNIRGQIPMVAKAGTVIALHHGIWHCGRRNTTEQTRYMFKLRLNPRVRQLRLWDTGDIDQPGEAGEEANEEVKKILNEQEPWFELADGRLEIVNRIKLWRFLIGDEKFDVSYWLTRLENMPQEIAG